MKTTTGILGVAILALLATPLWWQIQMIGRVDELEGRLALQTESIESRMQEFATGLLPIHTRCKELATVMEGTKLDVATVESKLQSLGGEVEGLRSHSRAGSAALETLKRDATLSARQAQGALSQIRDELNESAEEKRTETAALERIGARIAQLEALRDSVPTGTILPWIPRGGTLPAQWSICDGSNGTPDLRGLFLRGVGSAGEAAYYGEAERMQPAGLHAHATQPRFNISNQVQAVPKNPGEWLVLYDTGIASDREQDLAAHGSHVHEDSNVPAHFTVVYIIKLEA